MNSDNASWSIPAHPDLPQALPGLNLRSEIAVKAPIPSEAREPMSETDGKPELSVCFNIDDNCAAATNNEAVESSPGNCLVACRLRTC
jgi:hypothetical protein